MNRRRTRQAGCVLLVVSGWALGAGGQALVATTQPAAPSNFLLTGGPEGLWLVRRSEDGKTFDVLARPISRKWMWVTRDAYRPPAVAAGLGRQLHLLPAGRMGHLVLLMKAGESPIPAAVPDRAHPWASGAEPIAACAGKDFHGAGWSLVVVTRRRGATSRPVVVATVGTQPAQNMLSVLHYHRGEWLHLGNVPTTVATASDRVCVAVAAGRLLLLASGRGGNRLAIRRRDEDVWQRIDLKPLVGAKVVGVVGMDAKAAVILGRSVEGAAGKGQTRLEIVNVGADGKVLSNQRVVRDGRDETWPSEHLPMVARLGGQVALVGRWEGAMQMALVDPAGQLLPPESIDALTGSVGKGGGREIIQYFLFALLAAMVASSLLLRPPGPPGFFTLPETFRRAPILRRLAAAAIDLLPFFVPVFVATLSFMKETVGLERASYEEMKVVAEGLEDDLAFACTLIVTLVLHLVYCVSMELHFGATVGKMLLGLRVVGDGGKPVGLRNVLMRNLIKVAVLVVRPFLFATVLLMVLGRNRQRLGDVLARTAVVWGPGTEPPPILPADPDRPERDDQPPPGDESAS